MPPSRHKVCGTKKHSRTFTKKVRALALSVLLGSTCSLIAQEPAGLTNYYVNNVNGNDSNDGLTTQTAWRSLNKVNQFNFSSPSAVLLYGSQIFQTMLIGKLNLQYVGSYGPTGSCSWNNGSPSCVNRPIIDPTKSIPSASWQSVDGATYKAPFPSIAYKVFVDGAYAPTTPLQPPTNGSPSGVMQQAGTMISDGTFIYVHLSDNSSPANHDIRIASSDMPYGIITGEAGNVTIDGLVVAHAPVAGIAILNPDNSPGHATGGNVTVENSAIYNSGSTVYNNGTLEPLTDPQTFAKTDANIAVIPAAAGQAMIHNILIMQAMIGRLDVPSNTNNYDGAGISLKDTYQAYLQNVQIATVNGWGLSVDDYYSTSEDCQGLTVQTLEVTNSEGNIRIAGCSTVSVTDATVHDSKGNGFQLQPGHNHAANYITLTTPTIHDLTSAYSGLLYNGIDTNWAKHLTVNNATIYKVAESSITLEDDGVGEDVASTGFSLNNSNLDASQNRKANGGACSATETCFPLYVRDNALALNDWSVHSLNLTPVAATMKVARWGAASASDPNHDLTQDQFNQAIAGH
ncbi:hypothetical protein Terro_4275 [Terriglobus roseus DSM 18391]|uniref:Right handed beta helix region n=1 Tax=Terriglobus roseus (strain DSM 18391 / NRRL B-41598 / KBS 63) TaxID=926566 RepID=I3ZMK9_TERRK|nr:hypothetical protein [Terriglobus roseus]AFL90477.1 hypothetical protein Terro_4275 [Terriglobus roseus DSM 18391]